MPKAPNTKSQLDPKKAARCPHGRPKGHCWICADVQKMAERSRWVWTAPDPDQKQSQT